MFLASSWLWSYRQEHADKRQAASANQTEQIEQQRQTTCIDVAKGHSFPCVAYTPAAEPSEKYTAYDLEAQQDMAEWALAMVLVSALGVLVTLAATIYVALTLHETRRMAHAAESANVNARKMGEAQVRAYLSVSEVTGHIDQTRIRLVFDVSNAGNSPARHVEVGLSVVRSFGGWPPFQDVNPVIIHIGTLRPRTEIKRKATIVVFEPLPPVKGVPTETYRLRMRIKFLDVFKIWNEETGYYFASRMDPSINSIVFRDTPEFITRNEAAQDEA